MRVDCPKKGTLRPCKGSLRSRKINKGMPRNAIGSKLSIIDEYSLEVAALGFNIYERQLGPRKGSLRPEKKSIGSGKGNLRTMEYTAMKGVFGLVV